LLNYEPRCTVTKAFNIFSLLRVLRMPLTLMPAVFGWEASSE
jgi:hypothetical protein